MKKEDVIELIESRIETEFKKYHDSPVDFIKTSSRKIALDESQPRSKKCNPAGRRVVINSQDQKKIS